MSLWVCILAVSACGGAFVLWHAASRTKATSEQMLRQYADMLADARQRKAREIAEREAAAREAEEVEEV